MPRFGAAHYAASGRARALVVAGVAVFCAATPTRAQFPAELAGRVIDAATSQPIAGAIVELESRARTVTDETGGFFVRDVDAGAVTLVVTGTGYDPSSTRVLLESGRTARIVVALELAPIEIEALQVFARAHPQAGYVLTGEAIAGSGARTLGDLVRALPAVVVRTVNGAERVSIRGSGADAVLVLLDGAPLNDALTGEADLSLVPLGTVHTVRVLPGARTARFGPRAEAGVILIESRTPDASSARASARVGSLGERAVDAEAGAGLGSLSGGAGARIAVSDGAFDYEVPPALGGGGATRSNGSQRALGAFGTAAASLAGAPLVLRADVQDSERGLPGPIHALTPDARQEVSRTALGVGWHRAGTHRSLDIDANLAWQRTRHEDPAPAFGPAYFDTTRAREAGVRLEAGLRGGVRVPRGIALGAELRATHIESTALAPRAIRRTDPGLFMRGEVQLADTPLGPRLGVALRADRWAGEWIASHDVGVHFGLGPVAVHASHRSAFSPPALSDQFFRSGFAIAPNPDLEPERVPSEIEVGASAALEMAGVPVQIGMDAYRGDIRGMIVWAPDFRFVWSPRNRDVRRSGGEAWLRVEPHRSVRVNGWASMTRVTYDWPGGADTVQVAYRPRYSGGAALEWDHDAWHTGLTARYTGVRYATPGHANALPAYVDVDAVVGREWRIATALLTTSLIVERVLDNTDAFVHGYPEPGRRVRLEVRIEPAANDDETRSRYVSR